MEASEEFTGFADPPMVAGSLHALLAGFVEVAGIPQLTLDDCLGLEFIHGPFVVQIYPIGEPSARFSVDVQALGLAETDWDENGKRFGLLHRLNDLNRSADEWIATINSDSVLVISRILRCDETTPERLADLVLDGIERAKALADGWGALEADLWRSVRDEDALASGAIPNAGFA
jgi:hypothetical protein